jgi:hypothetical protein
MALQSFDDSFLVFRKVTPDDWKIEAGKNGRVALALQQKLEGLLDQLFRCDFPACEPLMVLVLERYGVNRRALRPYGDPEVFGILFYNFDLCVGHRMLFHLASRNVNSRLLERHSEPARHCLVRLSKACQNSVKFAKVVTALRMKRIGVLVSGWR